MCLDATIGLENAPFRNRRWPASLPVSGGRNFGVVWAVLIDMLVGSTHTGGMMIQLQNVTRIYKMGGLGVRAPNAQAPGGQIT